MDAFKLDSGEEARGLIDGSDIEAHESGNSRASSRCPYPVALWEIGKDPPFPVG